MPHTIQHSMKGATILVTGGAGFIGSHLIGALLERGAKRIIALDSLRYGSADNLPKHPSLEVVKFQLGTDSPARLAEALTGVDYLFHLAAEKHNQSLDNPIEVMRSNIEGMHTLLDLAVKAGVKKVVFSSSLYSYGRLDGPPCREDEVPRPTTVYGISKLAGEHLCAHFFRMHKLSYNVVRYFFVYGPKQYAGMGYRSVIVKNGEQLIAGKAPTIYGDGKQELDYVFVDDVVDATMRAMETNVEREVINIGSGVATSVNHLIDRLIAVAGKNVTPTNEPPDWTAGTSRVGVVEKAKALLDWRATTPLEEGLRRTYRWMSDASR